VPAAVRLLGVVAATLLAACASSEAPPPVVGHLPSFHLIERSGQPFSSEQLRGKVWVANFIFTTCPDICPALTAQMRRLDDLVPPDERPQRVSFSVDPLRDTPAVLSAYATRHGAGSNWFFLTGDRGDLARLLKDGFHVAFADDGPPTQPITHSDRLVLIDAVARIRGYYHGRLEDDLHRLVRDLRALRRESPPTTAIPNAG
jgi:protein SCO1/2